MKRDAYGLALLTMLLAAGSAAGQSTVQQQNSTVNQPPPGMPRYDQRWQNLGSGHSSLGLESMPRSLDLRLPQSTGVPRPTYGYRPDPLYTYVPPSSTLQSPLQNRFALPRSMQPAAGVSQPLAGRTRFMADYTDPAAVPPGARPYRAVTEPVGPIQINPVGPAEPSDRSLPPYRQMTPPDGGAQVLQLPRLPWESAAGPTPDVTPQQPGTRLSPVTSPVALPRGGEANLGLLPGAAGSPLDLILQGGPGRSIESSSGAPAGNLLRPIAPPPEQAEPPEAPAPIVGSEQVPAVTDVQRQPEVASAATLNAAAHKHLDKAEAHLRAGEYAQAATSYNLARVVAPKNPVPLLGRAVAQLANREYNSSANSLLLAVELSSDPTTFRQDLKSLLPDPSLLKSRMEELQADLARFDDFRLRFLLGYAEYCSGDETVGMIDMTQAVHKMPPERAGARRLLEALRKDHLSRSATTTAPAAER